MKSAAIVLSAAVWSLGALAACSSASPPSASTSERASASDAAAPSDAGDTSDASADGAAPAADHAACIAACAASSPDGKVIFDVIAACMMPAMSAQCASAGCPAMPSDAGASDPDAASDAGDADGGACTPQSTPITSIPSCDECLNKVCCNEMAACFASPSCVQYAICFQQCP